MDAHLAQINIGTMIAATDDPRVAEFMDNLDRVNAIADAAPGFVWRLQTDEGNATSIQIFPDPLTLVNMSVWESVDALKAYVYRSDHVDFFRRRAEWFEAGAKRVALWWVAPGTVPQLDDAVRRVAFLERRGPTPYAFGFGSPPEPMLIEATTPDDPDIRALIDQLDAEPIAMVDGAGVLLRARHEGRTVGCAALEPFGPGRGELTRLFVAPEMRGRLLGAALVDQIELHADRLGVRELTSVTGPRPDATALLEGAGYTRCGPQRDDVAAPAAGHTYRKLLSAGMNGV